MTKPRDLLSIFWVSVLGLYLELLLIRWIGTEIRVFAYLQNTVLVVCFLGLGIGLFTTDRKVDLRRGLFALAVLAAALAIPPARFVLQRVSSLLSVLGEINIWATALADSTSTAVASLLVGLAIVFAIMVLIVEPFVQLGRILGKHLEVHPAPIVAYTANVAGSLLGIWLFVAISRLSQPPSVWFLVLALLFLPYVVRGRRTDWISVVLLLPLVPLVLSAQKSSGAIESVWSPYQKLELIEFGPEGTTVVPTARYQVLVNNFGYQLVLDLSQSGAARAGASEDTPVTLSTYDVPALLHPDPERTLVVGSGTGNDVAGLLRSGAAHITAVDIDPDIVQLGTRYHPEQPYSSDRVEVVTTDARSFFARTEERFDVIAFGFLDAHTSTSLTNARLDHYVYTEESFIRVRDLLEEGGIVTVAFFPLRSFIIDRIAVQLRNVFGEDPLAYYFPLDAHGSEGVLLIAGDLDTARDRIASIPELERLSELEADHPVQLPYTTRPSSDNWPYLYLEAPRIPLLFVLLAGLFCVLVLHMRRTMDLPSTLDPRTWTRDAWHFFFLGAAFLLLEVQSISKASVVLGNTWLVNAVIITGVLCMVLAANAVVLLRPGFPGRHLFALLVATVLVLYFVDLARFAFLPFAQKAALVAGLTTLPMFFGGIAFARAFRVAERKDHAFGANLLGSLVGAILEPVSFLVGLKALLLIVAVLYLAAGLTRPDSGGSQRLRPLFSRAGARIPGDLS